jgi:membrane protease subunit HflK
VDIGANADDILLRAFRALGRRFGGRRRRFNLLMVIGIIAALWIVFTGLFTVAVDEVAVIQRFGKYNRVVGPGLRFKLPDGIEKKTKVRIQHTYSAEFGFRTEKAGVRTSYEPEARYRDEALMLTGDLNCALVPWIVQFKISDPRAFLFNVRDVMGTLRDLSEAAMREVIGDRSINEVLTARQEIADKAQVKLHQLLQDAGTGLSVTTVELQNTNVPEPVQPSFNEVNQATQEKEKMIYQAREAYNKVIPAAAGEAEKIVSEAEGYALARINKARGDSSRFVALYNEYSRSRDVTRRRLYLETMGDVFPKMGAKHIIDSDQKSVLPLLNLFQEGGVR